MRKEIETTEEAFFCDICKDEIRSTRWAYGGYASASEETVKCSVCDRDTCPKCRGHFAMLSSRFDFAPSSKRICKECLELNKVLLERIEQNKKDYCTASRLLQKRYLTSERALGRLRKALAKREMK